MAGIMLARAGLLALALAPGVPATAARISPPKVFVADFRTISTSATASAAAHQGVNYSIVKSVLTQHSCADVMDGGSVRNAIDFDRTKQLLGSKDESSLAEIAGAVGAQYVFSGTIVAQGTGWDVTILLYDMRRSSIRKKVIHRVPPGGDPVVPARVMKEFLDLIPACELTLSVEQRMDAVDGRGMKAQGAFASQVKLAHQQGGAVEGKGTMSGRIVPVEVDARTRENSTLSFTLPITVTGARDDMNYVAFTVKSTSSIMKAMPGTFAGAGTTGNTVTMRYRVGEEKTIVTPAPGGRVTTTLKLSN